MYNQNSQETTEKIAAHIREILQLIGEDPDREGLKKTPIRAAKALMYITQGYMQNPAEIMRQAIFEYAGSRMVVVKDIEFYSMCEHHILPFFGTISIGYIPNGNMIGLSKLARLVDVYARRLQVQERLTAQICKEIMETLNAAGAMVVCTGQHMCMKMRGVEKQNSATTTMDYAGTFVNDPGLQAQFLQSLRTL